MTTDPQLAVRRLPGPSVEAEETVTVVGLQGLDAGDAMETAWHERWHALCRRLGIAVRSVSTAPAAAAVATEGWAAAALGRPPASVRPGRQPGEFLLPDMDRRIALAAGRLGLASVDLTRAAEPMAAVVERMAAAGRSLQALAADLPGPPARPMALVLTEAFDRLGLPWHWSTAYPGIATLGEGRYATLFDGVKSLREPVMGGMLAVNKLAIKRYLGSFGLPVLPDRIVPSADAAPAAATALGYPIAAKPIDGSLGRGLSLDVRTPEEARAAFDLARPAGTAVMFEPYLDLPDFRAVLVGGAVALVFCRVPPTVVGDGRSTIAELLDAHDAAVAAGTARFPAKHEISRDDDLHRTLARHGLTVGSVLADGRELVVHTVPLLHTGGYAQDVTQRLHPANAAMFRRLAALTGLAVIAVDFRAEDLGRPWTDQRFGILEFNSRPNFGDFVGHPMIDAMVRLHAPDAEAVRLPTILAIDPAPGDAPQRLRDRIAAGGLPYAVRGPDGLWLGGIAVRLSPGDAHARMVEDPTLAVAIHWVTPESACRYGIGARVFDLAFLPPAPDAVPTELSALVGRLARRVVSLPGDGDALADAILLAAGELAARR